MLTWNDSTLVLPPTLTLEEWGAYGSVLELATDRIQWAIGDWLNYGEMRFGEAYAQFVSLQRWKPQTLQNWKYVAKAFPPDERTEKSFGHHATVASLTPKERQIWLEKATAQEWTVEEFREAVHGNSQITHHASTFTQRTVKRLLQLDPEAQITLLVALLQSVPALQQSILDRLK